MLRNPPACLEGGHRQARPAKVFMQYFCHLAHVVPYLQALHRKIGVGNIDIFEQRVQGYTGNAGGMCHTSSGTHKVLR